MAGNHCIRYNKPPISRFISKLEIKRNLGVKARKGEGPSVFRRVNANMASQVLVRSCVRACACACVCVCVCVCVCSFVLRCSMALFTQIRIHTHRRFYGAEGAFTTHVWRCMRSCCKLSFSRFRLALQTFDFYREIPVSTRHQGILPRHQPIKALLRRPLSAVIRQY
jgi:hypothetical protein